MILNKDPWNQQEVHIERFRDFVQSSAALQDVSPEHAQEFLPEPFRYTLRPGQGKVLVTVRK